MEEEKNLKEELIVNYVLKQELVPTHVPIVLVMAALNLQKEYFVLLM
ncbi:hypothetical protein KAOT1_09971 [Kordia algicida OT-1]|uniref:Uncharacterized protein n=1 Tax=Kordia algicida OT-1 TaxID=391587 RepID=A9ECH9_9FLAO|nr:hypothetical protein KAOT1_09971 [Kordia algicida OT-1]